MGGNRLETDVAIIGGGPAGSAAALTLLRYTKHRVVLVEASSYAQPRPGETVSAAILPLLEYLDAASALPSQHRIESYEATAAWGGAEVVARDSIFSGRGQGFHIDRPQFDAALAARVKAIGGRLLSETWLRGVDSAGEGWRLRLARRDERVELTASQVIDATGRRASLARTQGAQRESYDRLVGVVAYLGFPPAAALPQAILVESEMDGWWYSAPLPGGRAVVAFMGDAGPVRDLQIARGDVFRRRLCATVHTRARLAAGTLLGEPRVYPAHSHKLVRCIGVGWVAVGEAAAAFDPLSSLGIGHALASGIQGARVADERMRGRGTLVADFQADIDRHVSTYLAERVRLYALERRFRNAPFWAGRQM